MENSIGTKNNEYEIVPPDGGWAYVLFLACFTGMVFTLEPISCFPLIFGPFLEQFCDEITAVTSVMSAFMAAYYIAGFLAYILLQLLTYRKVALIGASTYVTGSFCSIFTNSLQFTIVSYGMLQGLGTGLILPSFLTATNVYFRRKRLLALTLGPCLVALVNTAFPGVTSILLDKYGFRGTQAIFAALGLHAFLGTLTLQPVKWHTKRKLTERKKGTDAIEDYAVSLISRKSTDVIDNDPRGAACRGSTSYCSLPPGTNFENNALVSHCSYQSKRNYILKLVDLSLLNDIYYWNMVTGLSLCVFAEANFLATLPILLQDIGFKENEVTLAMTVYLMSDLAGKIVLTLTTALCSINIRKLVLANVISTIAFRIGFTAYSRFWWIISIVALMGCSRSVVHMSTTVVIAKEYTNNFSNAYTLCMALIGITSIALGSLIGFVKYKTGSDVVVFHVSTAVCLICSVLWLAEFAYKRFKSKMQG